MEMFVGETDLSRQGQATLTAHCQKRSTTVTRFDSWGEQGHQQTQEVTEEMVYLNQTRRTW